jgi:hypothetical protein
VGRVLAAVWPLLIPLLVASCGSRSFIVQQKPSKPFSSYGQVVVEPFTVDGIEKLGLTEKGQALEAAGMMTQYLKERLEGKKWFKEGGDQVLTIRGVLVGFDPGSQAMRYWVGFGAGSGEVIADTTFLEANQGAVARGAAKGTVSGGWFGGSTSSACDRVAKAIIDFIKANYQRLE